MDYAYAFDVSLIFSSTNFVPWKFFFSIYSFLYDISISPYYELTYLWFAQCTYLAVCGSVGVDCLFYGSAFNISAHFQIVQNKIRHINFAVIAIEEKKRYGKRVATREFFEVIRYHQKLLNICDKFEHMYAPVLFTQFLITSVQLCVIAFQLTLVSFMIREECNCTVIWQ